MAAFLSRQSVSFALGLAALAAGAAGCNLENPGAAPARGLLNFPTALSLSPVVPNSDHPGGEAAEHLLVVNSNFDLSYNKGSLQAYALQAIADRIGDCVPQGPAADCEYDNEGVLRIDPEEVLEGEALIDSFGTAIALSAETDPAGDHRIFVPIRSQGHLSSTNYLPGRAPEVLSCADSGRKCSVDHQFDESSVVNARELSLPGEPVGVIAGRLAAWNPEVTSDANFVMVAHSPGEVSLFIDVADGVLALTDTLDTFPSGLAGIAFDAQSQLAYMTGAGASLIRVGVTLDPDRPEVATLYDGGTLRFNGISSSSDTRAGIILPAADGGANEALVVTEFPDALLYVRLGLDSRTQLSTSVLQAIEVGGGASRLTSGLLTDDAGTSREVIIVSCFNGRQLFVIDRAAGTTLSVVPNFSGPFEIALDGPRGLLYVADFRSSVIRIVDVRPILSIDAGLVGEPTTAAIVATLGKPRVVQELQ